jgi:hypothetical protein
VHTGVVPFDQYQISEAQAGQVKGVLSPPGTDFEDPSSPQEGPRERELAKQRVTTTDVHVQVADVLMHRRYSLLQVVAEVIG